MHLHRKHPEFGKKEKRRIIKESVQNITKNKTKEPLSKTINSPSKPGLGMSLIIDKKVLKRKIKEDKNVEYPIVLLQERYEIVNFKSGHHVFIFY